MKDRNLLLICLAVLSFLFYSINIQAQENHERDIMIKILSQDHRSELEKISATSKSMKEFILAQKDVNNHFEGGQTLLHYAAIKNYGDNVRLLLKKGADIKAADNDIKTPLHEAIRYSAFDAVKILVENGADLNILDEENETPLAGIVFWDDNKKAVAVVNLFIKKGYDLKNPVNAKLIKEAIQRERHDISLILLKNGVSFDNAALTATVRAGYDDIYNILLEKGLDPKQKVTLHDACTSGNINIISSLTSKGMKPSAEEIDFCLYNGHKEAAVYLNSKLREEKKEAVNIQKRCYLKPSRGGPCKALYEIAYFDAASNTCKESIYGGCGGTVPFADLDACRRVCEQ